jgi:beta-lactamase regulating signal transducer with metallopeptidase domain
MTSITSVASAGFLAQLVDSAARSLTLAIVVGLTLRAFRIKSTSLRLASWTAVLYVALAMPMLKQLLPQIFVPMPSFRQFVIATSNYDYLGTSSATPNVSSNGETGIVHNVVADRTDTTHAARTSAFPPSAPSIVKSKTSIGHSLDWATLCTGIYLAVALFLLTRFFIGLIFSQRLIRASRVINDHRAGLRLAARAAEHRLRFIPSVMESQLISVPITIGAIQSTILLPANWREWDDAKLDAVISHEVSHVARRDALTLYVSLLHHAIFWFSPLAWWLDRHLSQLAEQASDEAALCCGVDRDDYAQTLLGFFEAAHAAPGRVRWQGVSMAKAGQVEERLERILAWRGVVTMGLKKSGLQKSILIAVITFALPIVFLAASIAPAAQRPALPPSPSTAPASALEPVAPISPAGVSSEPLPPAITSAMPAPPAPIAGNSEFAQASPVPPLAPQTTRISGSGYLYSYGDDDEQRFVIVSGKTDALTMSGSTIDARHAEKLRKQIAGDFIWFQRDEKSYIIRDQATIDRARKLWTPQEELGKKQEELGKQQEALGKQQEALGKKMEEIQVKVPDMTTDLDRLKAQLQKLGSNATREQLGDLQSEIGDLQSKIGEIQSQAGDQQSKLGEEMGALGSKQGKLGEEQGELGRQQGELAKKASEQMREILDQALKNGTAQPEPGSSTL